MNGGDLATIQGL